MAAPAEERELAVSHRVGDSPWTRQTDRKGRDWERQERFSTCLVVSCHDVMDSEACMRCLVHLPARRLVCPESKEAGPGKMGRGAVVKSIGTSGTAVTSTPYGFCGDQGADDRLSRFEMDTRGGCMKLAPRLQVRGGCVQLT